MQHTNRPKRDVRRVVFALAILAAFGLLAANGCPPQTIQETQLLGSDLTANDAFASSVSVAGDVIVVGAYRDGAAYVFRFNGTDWVEEAKLLASDGYWRGSSVSVAGDVIVVGSEWDDDNGSKSGSAYVFRFDGTEWVEEVKLLASDGFPGGYFGRSVSVAGDVIVVGCRRDVYSGGVPGAAYVFRFNGTDWVEEVKLLASDEAAEDGFGRSVSVADDVIVVGAYSDGDNGGYSGAAYVFRFNGTDWVEQVKLLASDGASGDYFGYSVSVSGDVAVVGAHYDDDNGNSSGSAYVYRLYDGPVIVDSGIAESGLGFYLADEDKTWADGQHVGRTVVVRPLADAQTRVINGTWASGVIAWSSSNPVTPPIAPGDAYEIRASWVEEDAKLLASDGASGDRLGISVSVSGDVAVVGAYQDDDNGGNSGSAYLFRFDGTSWVEMAKLLASDGAGNRRLGSSVSVSGDVAAMAPATQYPGPVYVFSPVSGIPACSDARDNDGDGLADLDDPGCAVALDTSEHSGLFECDDGRDNDSDGDIDYPNDIACTLPTGILEAPECQDGNDNDYDGLIDFDGGQSIHGDCLGGSCPPGVSDPDGDGVADPDPECGGEPWATREFIPDCEDGEDNDGDGFTDYPEDPGCGYATSQSEDPQCQDGNDNDYDGLIDFDGGQSIHGDCLGGACPPGVSDPDGDGVADPDPQCWNPWDEEAVPVVCYPYCWGCGLGFELALILPGLMWLHRRRRRLH